MVAAAALLAALSPASLAAGKEVKSAPVKPYPLETCLVSDEKLGDMGDPFVFTHEGREIMLCCKSCKKDFDKQTAKFVAKVDAAWKKVKPYKLETCLVSGEKLGDMGKVYAFVHKGQEIKLCCKDCKKGFAKDPARFLKQLER